MSIYNLVNFGLRFSSWAPRFSSTAIWGNFWFWILNSFSFQIKIKGKCIRGSLRIWRINFTIFSRFIAWVGLISLLWFLNRGNFLWGRKESFRFWLNDWILLALTLVDLASLSSHRRILYHNIASCIHFREFLGRWR